jgi:hypothetical protein
MRVIRHVLYEEIEDYDAYEFFLMKHKCTCEKEFKTIGIQKGCDEIKKEFKQLIPTNNIHQKQVVAVYLEE